MRPAALLLAVLLLVPACSAPAPPARRAVPTRRVVRFDASSDFGRVLVVEEQGIRYLRFGAPGAEDQSAFDPARPDHEPLAYVRASLASLAYLPPRARVLMVGLGGGSFLRHARSLGPDLALEAVEVNPVVITAARRHLGLADRLGVTVHLGDGRRFLEAGGAAYDLIFLDAYDDVDYPRALGTREFFAAVRRRLSPAGVVIANLSPNHDARRADLVRTFRAAFPAGPCLSTPDAGNTLVLGGPAVDALPEAAIPARLRALDRRSGARYQLAAAWPRWCRFSLDGARVLTDATEARP